MQAQLTSYKLLILILHTCLYIARSAFISRGVWVLQCEGSRMHEYWSFYYFIQTGLFYFNRNITSFQNMIYVFRKHSEGVK